MRLIDADVACKGCVRYGTSLSCEECVVKEAPTIDAVPVDTVAQILNDNFGDDCPCNFNNNDEWLPMVCDSGETCDRCDEPLYCWKQFLKHYGERKEGAE